MPFTSCPHCGRKQIPFELHEAHTVLVCARCDGRFTPIGGAVAETHPAATSALTGSIDYTPAPRRSNAPAIIAIGFALFTAVVLGAVFTLTSDSDPPPKKSVPTETTVPNKQRPTVQHSREDSIAGWVAYQGLACVCGLLFFILWVLLLAWVARDCRCRGVDGGAVWVLIALFMPIVGVLIYLVSRPHGTLAMCQRCGNKRLSAAFACPHCGNKQD